jgi:hypothetical protein
VKNLNRRGVEAPGARQSAPPHRPFQPGPPQNATTPADGQIGRFKTPITVDYGGLRQKKEFNEQKRQNSPLPQPEIPNPQSAIRNPQSEIK